MRETRNQQFKLGQVPIGQVKFSKKSRDDIPQLLKGLQFIYVNQEIREQVFAILEQMVPEKVDPRNGRPGMELWKILVMGVLRLNLNWDYDRLQEMVNNHKTIRQMLGHGMLDDDQVYNLQTIKDNVFLLTPDVLDAVNEVVVKAGHSVVKKKEGEPLRGRCDSFVLETDVHYPTDINLLLDASRKVISLVAALCDEYDIPGWRQSKHNIKKAKKIYRKAQKAKRSTSKDPKKKAKRERLIVEAHEAYLDVVDDFLVRVDLTVESLREVVFDEIDLSELLRYVEHARRQSDQVRRRVLQSEEIPHDEKVFSIFEEHTEWISKGKAGVPVELGVRVCVLEDQYGFILQHHVMYKQTDDQVAVPMVEAAKKKFPGLRSCSFDKGFHSPENQEQLPGILDFVVLPKKGRLSSADYEREHSAEFLHCRRKHSAVESAINALEVHGLDKCPDHGTEGFDRYVSLAVLARNLQKLGSVLQKREQHTLKRRNKKRKAS